MNSKTQTSYEALQHAKNLVVKAAAALAVNPTPENFEEMKAYLATVANAEIQFINALKEEGL